MASPWGAGTTFQSTVPLPWKIGAQTYGLERPLIMGILNTTPDSFFDGGRYEQSDMALDRALKMVEQGADIIDVGAESSRPGAMSITVEEEIKRLKKILPLLTKRLSLPLSVDTTKAAVAEWAVGEGAAIINDISGLQADGEMCRVVAQTKASVVINHMQGRPENMQVKPDYKNVVDEVRQFLEAGIKRLGELGVPPEKIAVDPGIGFGKSLEHNLLLLKYLEKLGEWKCPILLGPSRKSFIGKIPELKHSDRLHPSMAVCLWAALKGVSVLRVHDVLAMKEQLIQIDAVLKA